MNIVVEKKTFEKTLYLVQGIIEKKGAYAVVSNVLIRTINEQFVSVSATNLELGFVRKIPAETVSTHGVILVPGRTLYELIKETDSPKVQIVEREKTVEIITETGDFKILKSDPDDFPQLPEFQSTSGAKLSAELLNTVIEKTAFAASTDETRYQLNGVFMKIKNIDNKTFLECVATDSHRLSLASYPVENSLSAFEDGVIIPRKGILEMKKILKEMGEDIYIHVDSGILAVSGDEITFTMRLVEGQFPDYESVLPRDFSIIYQIEREKLRRAVRRVMPLAYQKMPQVSLRFKENEVVVASASPDAGEGEEHVPVERRSGRDIEVVFNANYVEDAIDAFDASSILFKGNDEQSAWLIQSDDEPAVTQVIMPMRI